MPTMWNKTPISLNLRPTLAVRYFLLAYRYITLTHYIYETETALSLSTLRPISGTLQIGSFSYVITLSHINKLLLVALCFFTICKSSLPEHQIKNKF